MVGHLAWWALLVVGAGCAARSAPCVDPLTCRDDEAQRAAAFAAAVAREPPTQTPLEWVAPGVLVDRRAEAVYVGGAETIALDLRRGDARWRAASVSGPALWAAGPWLAVGEPVATPAAARLTFLDPSNPSTGLTCTLKLPVPGEANTVGITPFARGDVVLVLWSSSLTWNAGVPPRPEFEARQQRAEACGVVSVDPATCRTQPQHLDTLLFQPATDQNACRVNAMPALVASHAKPATGGSPQVVLVEERELASECLELARRRVEARDATGAVLWTHSLEDQPRSLCGPP